MLIRGRQIEALGESARGSFETRLLAHIREYFPVHWRQSGEQQLRAVARLGLDNAAGHGLKAEREVYLYVSLMLYLGSQFDTDPQLPWASSLLRSRDLPDPYARIEQTYDAATAYLERVSGPDGQLMANAVQRLEKIARDIDRLPAGATRETLAYIHPEKFRELGEPQLNRLFGDAADLAARHALDARQGTLVFAWMQFLLGHGFARDPQFPWASEVPAALTHSDPMRRVNIVKDAFVLKLSGWFAPAAAPR